MDLEHNYWSILSVIMNMKRMDFAELIGFSLFSVNRVRNVDSVTKSVRIFIGPSWA